MYKRQQLRTDMIYGFKCTPQYWAPIKGPTAEEWAQIVKKQEEDEKKERRQDILDAIKVALFCGFLVFIVMAVPPVLFGLISLL